MATTDDELLAIFRKARTDFYATDDLYDYEWSNQQDITTARAVFEAGRREGAEQFAKDEIEWWESVREDHGQHIMTLRDARLRDLRLVLDSSATDD